MFWWLMADSCFTIFKNEIFLYTLSCNLFYKSLTYHKCPFILVNRDLWQHFKGLWRWYNAFQLDFEGLGKCMGRIQLEEGGSKSKRLFQEG